MIALVLFSALAFGVGFGLSWVRARRRMQSRVEAKLQAEMQKRMAEEVLRRLREGDIDQHVADAVRSQVTSSLREQGHLPQSGSAGEEPGSDARSGRSG